MQEFLLRLLLDVVATFQVLLGVGAAMALLALLVKGRKAVEDAKEAMGETVLNLKLIFFNLIVTVPVIVALSQVITALVSKYDLVLLSSHFWDQVPLWIMIPMAVFIGDFVGYWRHRFEHTKLFWPSHATHHSDTHMTFLTLERFHPINRISTFLIDSSVLILMGIPPLGLVVNNMVRHYYGFFIHANLPWTYGWLSRVLVSPAMHRWHHSADPRYFQTNFATVFSVFDRVFGTFHVPGPCTAPLGVSDQIDLSLKGHVWYGVNPKNYRKYLKGPRWKAGYNPDAGKPKS